MVSREARMAGREHRLPEPAGARDNRYFRDFIAELYATLKLLICLPL